MYNKLTGLMNVGLDCLKATPGKNVTQLYGPPGSSNSSVKDITQDFLKGQWEGRTCVQTTEKNLPSQRICYDHLIEFQETASKTLQAHIQSRKVHDMTLGVLVDDASPNEDNYFSIVAVKKNTVSLWMYKGLSFRIDLKLESLSTLSYHSHFKKMFRSLLCTTRLTKVRVTTGTNEPAARAAPVLR